MSQLPNPCDISPKAVQTRLASGDPLQLVDVRQPWEYARYHIPAIILIPLGELPARYAAELNPDAETICICEHGVRSETAARFLAANGFAQVATMTGGMSDYHGPLEIGPWKATLNAPA